MPSKFGCIPVILILTSLQEFFWILHFILRWRSVSKAEKFATPIQKDTFLAVEYAEEHTQSGEDVLLWEFEDVPSVRIRWVSSPLLNFPSTRIGNGEQWGCPPPLFVPHLETGISTGGDTSSRSCNRDKERTDWTPSCISSHKGGN